MDIETEKLAEVLDRLKDGGFAVGPDWHEAHEICQEREGNMAFDWLHALCHRIEGDDWNAGYWYRRAGTARGKGTIAGEWAAIRAELIPNG